MSEHDEIDQPPLENLPPVEESAAAADDLGTAPLSTDGQRGQRGPASEQTGAEQTGVDDTGVEPLGEPDVIGVGSGRTREDVPDPQTWATGDEPMTQAQRGFLESLARDAGETLPADLTKAEASEHIDRLQEQTGRG